MNACPEPPRYLPGLELAALLLTAFALAATLCSLPGQAQSRSGSYSLELIGESGSPLPTYQSNGRTYVLGTLGARYSLRVRNSSFRRIEVAAAVDGRDVLDGRGSSFAKRGYLVAPYGEVVIDGFRVSGESVAAFRFSSVSHSYAALMGDSRDVGTIGVAVFGERAPRPLLRRWLDGFSSADGLSGSVGGCPTCGGPSSGFSDKSSGRDDLRPGLGTAYGEKREFPVTEVGFVRATQWPEVVLTVRYDDAPGLRAKGVDLGDWGACRWGGCEAAEREAAEPFRRDFAPPPPGWRGE